MQLSDARELLALVYGWFTEGFDTPDLIEAGHPITCLTTVQTKGSRHALAFGARVPEVELRPDVTLVSSDRYRFTAPASVVRTCAQLYYLSGSALP